MRAILATALVAASLNAVPAARAADMAETCLLPQKLLLGSGGLALSGGNGCPDVPLPFDTPAVLTLPAIAKATGVEPSDLSRNDECGAGPMEFARFQSLMIMVQDDRFVGWSIDDPASFDPRTETGIGIGSTRAELEAALGPLEIQESTLTEGDQVEFYNDPIGGFLTDGTAAGTAFMLYSGITCFFR